GKSLRTLTYDNYGRLATDVDTVPPSTTPVTSTSYAFDRDDLLTSRTTAGVTGAGLNSYSYDDLRRATSWVNPGATTTGFGYDAASNRTTVTTTAGTRTSTYDARNRLESTTGGGGSNDSYTWNARGQLTTAVQNGQTLNYAYDAFERLTQTSGSV